MFSHLFKFSFVSSLWNRICEAIPVYSKNRCLLGEKWNIFGNLPLTNQLPEISGLSETYLLTFTIGTKTIVL